MFSNNADYHGPREPCLARHPPLYVKVSKFNLCEVHLRSSVREFHIGTAQEARLGNHRGRPLRRIWQSQLDHAAFTPSSRSFGRYSRTHKTTSSFLHVRIIATFLTTNFSSGMGSDLYSSGSSSGTHYVDTKPTSPDDRPKLPKFTPGQSFEFEELGSRPRASSSPPRFMRYGRALGVDHPKVQRVWLYLRGPRPKVDLPGSSYLRPGRNYETDALSSLSCRPCPTFESHIHLQGMVVSTCFGVCTTSSDTPFHRTMGRHDPSNWIHNRPRLFLTCSVIPHTNGCLHRLHGNLLGCQQWLWPGWRTLRPV